MWRDVSISSVLVRRASESHANHNEEAAMRFMVLVPGSPESEAGEMPPTELLEAMTRYNEELVKAGVMLAGEGLHPTSRGAKVRFDGDERTVIDGPFTEAKEIVAGYWVWECGSREEAIEWLKRAPFGGGVEIELRPIFEADDFGEQLTPELREANERLRDVSVAEDLAQDALVAALEQWPQSGIPENPGGWLMTTAKRRGVDGLRRRVALERKQEAIAREQELLHQLDRPDLAAQVDDVEDDVLRLIFMTCHPVLSRDARVALTLRLLGGLSTPEIARAFLVSDGTVAQRIVRAKRTLSEARVPFEVPGRDELTDRLSAVLEVIYLVFNEGYAATAGEHWVRPALCEDALRLGRILAGLMPGEPEVHGLLALMELQASRLRARVGSHGELVLLADQDRARWDHLLVQRGLAALRRAEGLTGALGPYTLQAAIAACHARAHSVEETDWPRVVALYDGLAALTGSPVVELNRAVAVSMAFGPEAGLELVDSLADEPALRRYHLLPSVRGDLLSRLGRLAEAREEFVRAADLCDNDRERGLLLSRAGTDGAQATDLD
jgi:RNA polymerase sigma factor (sigma-70 family)